MFFGFPFLSFVFQRRNGQWLDFLGPLTVPALVGNAIVGFLLPFVAVALLIKKRRAA
jgi:formate/nitrite transporter FocA (FNT family)